MVAISIISNLRSFLRRGGCDYLFNVDIVNFLLKNNGGRNRRPNFVIFVVRSALKVAGWVVVAWGRKSFVGPAESLHLCTRFI